MLRNFNQATFPIITISTSSRKGSRVSQYNRRIVSRSSSPEVCHVHSGSLEASRSRVGIAERDDILWFRCIVGT